MMANMFKAGMMAAALLVSTQTVAWSDNDGPMRHESDRKDLHPRHNFQNPDRRNDRDQVGGDGLPSVISGLGTFAGSVSALRARGNGIYFASTFDREDRPHDRRLAPRARVILVDMRENSGTPCSYEAGICVIRGGR